MMDRSGLITDGKNMNKKTYNSFSYYEYFEENTGSKKLNKKYRYISNQWDKESNKINRRKTDKKNDRYLNNKIREYLKW